MRFPDHPESPALRGFLLGDVQRGEAVHAGVRADSLQHDVNQEAHFTGGATTDLSASGNASIALSFSVRKSMKTDTASGTCRRLG